MSGERGSAARKLFLFSILTAALCRPALPADAPAPAAQKPSAEERIYKALGEPTQLEFVETPLSDVIDYLKDYHGIEIQVDKKALDDVGIGTDVPVTKNLKDISLRSALRMVLREMSLTYIVRNEVLLFTTPKEADSRMEVKVYDVIDLVTPAPPDKSGAKDAPVRLAANFNPLLNAVKACVESAALRENRGGCVAPFEAFGVRALYVVESQAVHEAVETLLTNLRAVRHGKPPAEFIARPIGRLTVAEHDASRGVLEKAAERRLAAEARLRRGLAEQYAVEFNDQPLGDVLDYLKEKTQLPLDLDKKALADRGIGADLRVSFKCTKRPLCSLLDELLRQVKLCWIVADEAILITTPQEADGRRETRVYDVADLPAFFDAQGKPTPEMAGPLAAIRASAAMKNKAGIADAVKPFDQGGVRALVITQSPRGHDRVAQCLALLRKLRKQPPA